MEPSSAECILRCLGIPVVAFHDTVSADDEFADLLAVGLDGGHVFAHDALLHHQISHALPRLQSRLLFKRQSVPFGLPLTESGRTVGLGQPVKVDDLRSNRLDIADHLWGRRRATRHDGELRGERNLIRGGVMGEVDQHRGGSTKMRDPFSFNDAKHVGRDRPFQANMRAGGRCNCPRITPAVAMEHRKRPEIPGRAGQLDFDHCAQRV